MKKILVDFYANHNFGDDLFLKLLFERYKNVTFYIKAGRKYRKTFVKYNNVTIISNPFYFSIINRIITFINNGMIKFNQNNIRYLEKKINCKKFDALIQIGGSIFIDIDGRHFEKNSNLINNFINDAKPVYILGCNFEKKFDEGFYDNYHNLFYNINPKLFDICFRDKYSYDLFFDCSCARYASDIIFSYSPKNISNLKKQIVISVIDLTNRMELKKYKNIYQKKIVEISRYFINNGFSVVLMGFCINEGDKNAIIQIHSQFKDTEKNQVKPFYYSSDLDGALMLIQESQYIIGSRFHAMILGWISKKPVYPLIYSYKSINVIKDIKYRGQYTWIQEIDKINAKDIYMELSNNILINIEEQTNSSNKQFKMIDEFLFD